jgi:hypothetical protein
LQRHNQTNYLTNTPTTWRDYDCFCRSHVSIPIFSCRCASHKPCGKSLDQLDIPTSTPGVLYQVSLFFAKNETTLMNQDSRTLPMTCHMGCSLEFIVCCKVHVVPCAQHVYTSNTWRLVCRVNQTPLLATIIASDFAYLSIDSWPEYSSCSCSKFSASVFNMESL